MTTKYIHWPDDLVWILEKLSPGIDQPTVAIRMDSGDVRVRPTRSALRTVEGEVDMDVATWDRLNAFYWQQEKQVQTQPLMLFKKNSSAPHIGKLLEPAAKSTTSLNGRPTNYVAYIRVIDHGPVE